MLDRHQSERRGPHRLRDPFGHSRRMPNHRSRWLAQSFPETGAAAEKHSLQALFRAFQESVWKSCSLWPDDAGGAFDADYALPSRAPRATSNRANPVRAGAVPPADLRKALDAPRAAAVH